MKTWQKYPMLCTYLLAFVLLVVNCLGMAAYDAVQYATGGYQTVSYAPESLESFDVLSLQNGQFCAVGGDARFIIDAKQPVRTVRVVGEYAQRAELELYPQTRQGGYSLHSRLWAAKTTTDSVWFYLPFGASSVVRIDPVNQISTVFSVQQIIINEPRSLASYFCLAPQQWFALLVLPAVVAALFNLAALCMQTIRALWANRRQT